MRLCNMMRCSLNNYIQPVSCSLAVSQLLPLWSDLRLSLTATITSGPWISGILPWDKRQEKQNSSTNTTDLGNNIKIVSVQEVMNEKLNIFCSTQKNNKNEGTLGVPGSHVLSDHWHTTEQYLWSVVSHQSWGRITDFMETLLDTSSRLMSDNLIFSSNLEPDERGSSGSNKSTGSGKKQAINPDQTSNSKKLEENPLPNAQRNDHSVCR